MMKMMPLLASILLAVLLCTVRSQEFQGGNNPSEQVRPTHRRLARKGGGNFNYNKNKYRLREKTTSYYPKPRSRNGKLRRPSKTQRQAAFQEQLWHTEVKDLQKILGSCRSWIPQKTSKERAIEAKKVCAQYDKKARESVRAQIDNILKAAVQRAIDDVLKKEMNLIGEVGRFVKIKTLGKGACGNVVEFEYTVENPDDRWKGDAPKKRYAVKMIEKSNKKTYENEKGAAELQKLITSNMAESKVAQLFVNPVIRTCDKHDKYFYIVMELGDSADFFDHAFLKGGRIQEIINNTEEEHIKFYAACLVRAIECMQSKNIAHRDLKPENLLIVPKTGYLQVTDFGFAKESTGKDMDRFCGTPDYISRDILLGKKYGVEVDWYSFGVILYSMLSKGLRPFYGPHSMRMTIKGYKYTTESIDGSIYNNDLWLQISPCSNVAKELVRSLLRDNYNDRWNATNEVRDHPWFNGFNWKLLDSGNYPAPWTPTKTNTGAEK